MSMESIPHGVHSSPDIFSGTEAAQMSHRNSKRLGKRASLPVEPIAPEDPFNDTYSATMHTASSPPVPTVTVATPSTLDRRASLISVPEALPVELISFVDAPSSHSYLTSPLRPPNSPYALAAPHAAPLSQQANAIARQNQINSNLTRTNWAQQVLLQQRDEKEESLAVRSAGLALRINAGTASPANSLTVPGLGTAAAAAVEGQKGTNGLQNLRTARSIPDVALQALEMAQSSAFAHIQPPPSYDAVQHRSNSTNVEKQVIADGYTVGASRSERGGGSSSFSGPSGPPQYPLSDYRTYSPAEDEKRELEGGMSRVRQPRSAIPRDVFAARGSGSGALLRESDVDRHIHRTLADRIGAAFHSTSNSSDDDRRSRDFDDEHTLSSASSYRKKKEASNSDTSKSLGKSKDDRGKWCRFSKGGNGTFSIWQGRMRWLILFGVVVMCLLVGMGIGIRFSVAMSEATVAKPSGTPPNFKVAPKSQYVLSDVVGDFCNRCNDFDSWCVCVNDPSSASNQTSTTLIDGRATTLSPPSQAPNTKLQKMRRDGPAVPAATVSLVRKGIPPIPTSRRPESNHDQPTRTPTLTPGDHATSIRHKDDPTTTSVLSDSRPHSQTSASTTTSPILQPDTEKPVDAVSMWCWCKPKQSPCTTGTQSSSK
ncbi:hypothetical protein BJ742DRAFT_782562 [Cladochytrium replicatum]|nr:hypothetical protein BJ742DRAFT_782562 [Cladochytrium replicatum]